LGGKLDPVEAANLRNELRTARLEIKRKAQAERARR